MTFISIQKFDENGQIKIFSKKVLTLEKVEKVKAEEARIKGKARVSFSYDTLSRDDIIPFNSLDEAEKYVLEECNVFWGMSNPPLNQIKDAGTKAAVRISLAGAKIMQKAKMPGKLIVVCHPSLRQDVDSCWDKEKEVSVPSPEGKLVNTKVKYFSEPLEVVENSFAPEDKVLVLLKGDEDHSQPLIYVEGEGLLINNKTLNIEDYGKFTRLV